MKKVFLHDFDTDYVTIYFRKAKVLGIDGLVCNLRGIRISTVPMHHKLKFYYIRFVDDKYAEICNSKALPISESSKLDMVIAGRELSQVERSENGILRVNRDEVEIRESYIYKYEFEEYMGELVLSGGHEHIIDIDYDKTIRYPNIDCNFTKFEKCYPEFRKASIKIDGLIRHFMYTRKILDDIGDCDGYKYYALYDKNTKSSDGITHLSIDRKYCEYAFATLISPEPIITDFNGLCYLDDICYFRVDGKVYDLGSAKVWLKFNKAKKHDRMCKKVIDTIDFLKFQQKKFGSNYGVYENEALFAMSMKQKLNKGSVGFIGKDMKFVYIDNLGRPYDWNGPVDDGPVMMFLVEKDGSMQQNLAKEHLSDEKYEAALKFSKNRYPNR